jgi:hypothetical protein
VKRKTIAAMLMCMLCCCATLHCRAQRPIVFLSGHVYQNNGKPLAGAKVSLFPLEVGIAGPMPETISDKDGGYQMSVPALGKTRILARLERLGYPNTFYKVFADPHDHFPEVTLARGEPLEQVDIHLGTADGIVDGEVIDRETGKVVNSAKITLRWANDPSVFLSEGIRVGGSFEYSLPKRPITITIDAPGYRTWSYTNASNSSHHIELDPAEHVSIRAELEKK